jgi:type III restriction enzyme
MLTNGPGLRRTIRIDSKLEEVEEVRRIVATVGRRGEPGEHVRCVVSVSMLTEGWDANSVTHILGVRAFGSQLLCEQVVGRGLRRMDYVPDPKTGLLTEEYVDVYGIPFSVIPFKSWPMGAAAPEDRPKNHVKALPERKQYEIPFPIVEGYAFALQKNAVRCNVGEVEKLLMEPDREPTATFVRPTVGYQTGHAASLASPFAFVAQDRREYYRNMHLQTIEFLITRAVVDRLAGDAADTTKARVLRLQSRHQLFPQVFRFVHEYVTERVEWQGCDRRELGLEKYFNRVVERLAERIEPDVSEGEQPLLPVLNRYKKTGSTAEVDFKTTKPCYATQKSHIDQVVLDTDRWEASAAFRLELSGEVECYARNDSPDRLTIPYEYDGQDHAYGPDFLVRLTNGLIVLLEVKGYEPDQAKAKHNAARRWVAAVNNWNGLGQWAFHVCYQPHLLEGELRELNR